MVLRQRIETHALKEELRGTVEGVVKRLGGLGRAWERGSKRHGPTQPAYASICQHMPGHVSIRQLTSAYVSIRQKAWSYAAIAAVLRTYEPHALKEAVGVPDALPGIRQHTSAYVGA